MPSSGLGSEQHQPRGWISFCVVVLGAVLGALLLVEWSRLVDTPAPPRFDEALLRRIKKNRPHVVLLGNSMVQTRFDDATLTEAVKPRRALKIAFPGSASATWYLALKNVVIASGRRPERVLLFFRHYELTEPRLRITGKYAAQMARLSREDEPVLREKLLPSDPLDRLRARLARFAPLALLHPQSESLADGLAVRVSNVFAHGADTSRRKELINDVFSLQNLREAPVDAGPAEYVVNQDFADAVGSSFLPEIIALTKERGLPLTFVRTRSREAALGQPDDPEYLPYLAALRRYFSEQGVEFVDMRDAAWEEAKFFVDTAHIGGRYRKQYTRLFVEHMSALFGVQP